MRDKGAVKSKQGRIKLMINISLSGSRADAPKDKRAVQ